MFSLTLHYLKNEKKASFLQRVYRLYIQSVIDHINNARVESTDFISSMSVFDPRHLQKKDEFSTYGMEKIKVLTSFYGTHQKVKFDGKEAVSQPDVDPEEAE